MSAAFASAVFLSAAKGPLVSASDRAMAVTCFRQTCLAQTAWNDFERQVATVGQPDGATAVNGAAGSAKRQPQTESSAAANRRGGCRWSVVSIDGECWWRILAAEISVAQNARFR